MKVANFDGFFYGITAERSARDTVKVSHNTQQPVYCTCATARKVYLREIEPSVHYFEIRPNPVYVIRIRVVRRGLHYVLIGYIIDQSARAICIVELTYALWRQETGLESTTHRTSHTHFSVHSVSTRHAPHDGRESMHTTNRSETRVNGSAPPVRMRARVQAHCGVKVPHPTSCSLSRQAH